MQRKRKTVLFVAVVLVGLFVLWGLGFTQEKTPRGTPDGFFENFDVKGQKAVFAYSSEGNVGIYISDIKGKNMKLLTEAGKDENVHHPVFSPDGKTVLYIATPKNREEMRSTLYLINIDGTGKRKLYSPDSLITEAVFAPDGKRIYMLKAETFKNYSPIARQDAHDFDIYSLPISGGEPKRITQMKDYMLQSLSVSPDGKDVYVTKSDNRNSKTAEDIFAEKNKIFRIPLAHPEKLKVVTTRGITEDVFDINVSPDNRWIAFNTIVNRYPGKNEVFQYELHVMDRKTGEIRQLTYLKKHAGAAVFDGQSKWIYFMVDQKFGRGEPVYEWYRATIDGEAVERIPVAITGQEE
jgi:Tol biopolymer transport system component